MKRKKTQRPTPEESLRQAAESRLGLDFDYKQIRDRLDVAEIARRADRTGTIATRAAIPSVSTLRRRPAVAVVTVALLLCATVGAGGMGMTISGCHSYKSISFSCVCHCSCNVLYLASLLR